MSSATPNSINKLPLAGRHILVTGGARGIGLALALSIKTAGAAVTVLARTESDLASARRELVKVNPSVQALAIGCDVTNGNELRRCMAEATNALGPIYGLVCAAGVYGAIGPFQSVDFEQWAKTIEINLTGTARTIHTALPLMSSPDGGRIVLFSGGGQAAMPHFSDYVTSKGGIWRLTETLGAELSARSIFVNAIAPGAINTKLLDDLLAAGPERVGQETYQRSLRQRDQGGQSPEKTCELCLYLLSPEAHGLYGKTISAVWDSYRNLENPQAASQTDLFCYRRVVDLKGNTRAQ